MAKVTIAGLGELHVHHVDEPGSFRVDMELARVGAELAEANGKVEQFKKLAEVVLCYVGHNEGIKLDRLLDVLPANVGPILKSLREVSGRAEVAATGEASRPEMRT